MAPHTAYGRFIPPCFMTSVLLFHRLASGQMGIRREAPPSMVVPPLKLVVEAGEGLPPAE